MIKSIGAVVFSSILIAAPATAQTPSLESLTLATNLGSVLASEEFCGLSYNQEAIAAFIGEEVEADDLTFASMLNMQTQGQEVLQQDMNTSQKTAHCTQTERVARTYGFID